MYIVLFSGFHGTHRPPAPPSHGIIEDNAPDPNDEADLDIPRYASSVGEIHVQLARFASAQFGEVPLQWICLSYTMYMFSISYVYTMYIICIC